ncbi:MAG: hypothetical protein GX194_07810 [Clostridium sp.]|nr:hypothetical protein [Clostridium sp.]
MRTPKEIKKDMEYPSAQVKTRCMNEVARYLRDAYKCGIYSEALEKIVSSQYYFGIDSEELMELLSEKYQCREICDNARLLRKIYREAYEIEDDENYIIPAGLKYKFICEQVIGKNLDYSNLTCADIDDFIEGIELIKIPGVLYPLMWLTHAKFEEVFLYIYNKYVLPAFVKLSEDGTVGRYDALSSVMCGYIEELLNFVAGFGQVFITSIPGNTTWNEVIVEFQRTGEFACIRQVKEKLKKADGIGMQLLKLHKENKDLLKKKYKSYVLNYYPMFAALVIFALLAEGKNNEAVEFMIDNYSDINEDNYQCAYVLILLFQTILLCDNYEYMNILYADLQKEKLLYERNYKDIYDAMMQSCEFIEELYRKISKPAEKDGFDYLRRFVKETVFEQWGLIQDIRNIRNQYAGAQEKVKSEMFRRVYVVMRAFSNREGIYVSLIAQTYGKNYRNSDFARRVHHDDKGCWDRLDEECRSMMITSEIVYRTLVARQDADELDYSASMIPLTKVIEYLLNEIYSKLKGNIVFDGPEMNIDFNSVRFFKDKNDTEPKECLEMGPAIRVLSDGHLKFGNRGFVYTSYFLSPEKSRFEEWKGNLYIDWSRLRDFKGTMLKCHSFDKGSGVEQFILGSDTEYNRKVFIGALEYIKNCYRNKVAHKDGINREKMEKCREDMLIAQKLIWMLIYIMKLL